MVTTHRLRVDADVPEETNLSARVKQFGPIPDSVVDNFESADGDPVGPYGDSETLTDYWTMHNVSSLQRTDSSPIADSWSLERTDSDERGGMVSVPGDGLPNYPTEGETVSLIVDDLEQYPGVAAAVPSSSAFEGYSMNAFGSEDWRLSRNDGATDRTDLDSSSESVSGPVEIVVSPPESGEDTVEGSVWSLNDDLTRDTQEITLSGSDSNYAGDRGVGIRVGTGSGTGVFADELRIGRGL